ncbi:MAG: PEP-CTERM sorting domain-containing protein [Armatimonadetes bacterium]|nr:PEP-CTERM sorting domain-containing protein [Armatimonadota bacterium]
MLSTVALAQRAPTVTYTVSGTAGNWDLNFTLQNNFNAGEGNFYFFGVLLDSGRDIVSSPGDYDPNTWTSWTNSGYGGSSLVYNNNWISGSYSLPSPGGSLGGFIAHTTDAVAPTAVDFFAYAYTGTYGGNDNFNNQGNPGFEGRAVMSGVPEPASFAALGLGALMLIRRRRSAK